MIYQPHPNKSLSSDDLIISSPSQSTKKKNKRPLTEDDTNSDNKLWTDSAIKLLLSYISEKFFNYRKNKEKFYINAALHIGGKTSAQVRGKVQGLVKKYTEEKKEETEKGTSK
ncbi:hypothetical protein C2G38_2217551 [Gigaspora rosea]|uniref:Uncharacterized protein n=1 Tax=Gigaspora rosea TaxID=44941 RepID=A0A397U7Q8_9GLOM|nr:hypothetical protein C2G38_2217551 [Gigaspora rosea]